jgi:hypothetical protein
MRSVLILTALALAGCSVAPPVERPEPPLSRPGEVERNPAGGTCDAAGAQSFIGQTATVDIGRAILAATHSKMLRWQWPGMMMTMEYSDQRVNVRYGPDIKILAVTCG